jgi:hypothetical protein
MQLIRGAKIAILRAICTLFMFQGASGCIAEDRQGQQFVLIEFSDLRVNLFLAGMTKFENVKFVGGSATPTTTGFNSGRVIGEGELVVNGVSIKYNSSTISVGEAILPTKKDIVLNYVMFRDGKIESGFLRSFK